MDSKHSFVFQVRSLVEAPIMSSRLPQGERGFLKVQFTLRVLAIAFTSAAMAAMLTSQQSVAIFGLMFQARYADASAFKFIVVADAVVCGFSLLSLILVFLLSRTKSNPTSYFTLFLHDLVMASLMMAGCGAATAIGLVGREGIEPVGWVAICNRFGRFCNKVLLSVSFSFMVFLCYLVLAITSVHKLKRWAEGTNRQQAQEVVSVGE